MKEAPCCISLQSATKWIAIVHGIMVVFWLCVSTYGAISLAPKCTSEEMDFPMPNSANLRELYQRFRLVAEDTEPVESYTIQQDGKTYYREDYVKREKVLDAITARLYEMMMLLLILVLDYQLYKGSVEKNKDKAEVWFLTVCVMFVFTVIFLGPVIFLSVAPGANVWFKLSFGVQLVVIVYMIWVIYGFMEQCEASGGGVASVSA